MISAVTNNFSARSIGVAESASLHAANAEAASGAGFSAALQDVASSAATALRQGEAAAIGGIQGTLPVPQVVGQVLAAEQTLQAAIAIRDKLVGAYLEINRMQI